MTNDPKLAGAPVMRVTNCRQGGHVFIHASYGVPSLADEPVPGLRCDCGTYTWEEWEKETTVNIPSVWVDSPTGSEGVTTWAEG